ncbi:MAG: DUF4190 domain-containing protein [Phycisphaerae bacterium]
MSLVLDCPSCRKAVTATADLVGRVMACPHCAKHFTIPEAGAAPVAVATPTSNTVTPLSGIRFTFTCQRCGSILESRGDLCDQQGRCPTCGAVFVIPQVDPRTGLPMSKAEVADDGQLPTPMHAYATAGRKAPTITRLDNGEQVIICPRCRGRMPVDSDTCGTCGMPFTMEGAAAIANTGPSSNHLAKWSMTIGVISVVTFCIPGLGLVAIGLGVKGLKRASNVGSERSGRTMALAGIVCGFVALGLNVMFYIVT